MGLLETRRMIMAGDLVLWHDYRSGHCANQAGYSAGTFDGTVAGTAGRFRTGYGYETTHNFVTGDSNSLGYIRVADNASFYPPSGGLCIIASYIQTDTKNTCQIIGQGDARGALSWQLLRSPTQIQFLAADGVAASTFAYNLAAVSGQVETVVVRYTGGTGAGNCTIYVLAPTPSSSTGQISRVPQDIAQPVSVCCFSNSDVGAFVGTMRYCAYVRGAQTVATIQAVAAEMEAITWPDAISECDTSGSTADRAVQYTSRFGVDQSIADEGLWRGRLSNSQWVFGDINGTGVGTWRVNTYHTQSAAGGSPSDVQKRLICTDAGSVWLPITDFSASTTQALAAYGTWDFWLFAKAAANSFTYVVHYIEDDGGGNLFDSGYAVSVSLTGQLVLYSMELGGPGVAIVSTAPGVIATDMMIRVRVTRNASNLWRLYYDIGNGWVYVGSGTNDTYTTSDGMYLAYMADNAFFLGNQRGDRAFFKWRGVVNPR